MDDSRIVITGIGVVAPNGIGKEEFWKNCRAGVSGIKPITLFDTSTYTCHLGGEISDFQPERYLGPKGLRNLDRTTLLALVAAKLAIDDSELGITDANAYDIGVVLGSTMGSVHSISSFDIDGLREGPRYVNPAVFPNTVINSPASQVSIRFGIKGLNTTIGTGFAASLNALEYAADMLAGQRIMTALVGGVEELCIETFSGFYELGFLPVNGNGHGATAKSSRLNYLGEGAGFVILELAASARQRGAKPYAELLGVASGFQPTPAQHRRTANNTIDHTVREVLKSSGLSLADVHRETSVKPLIGECFSAMGILQLITELGAGQSHVALMHSADPIGSRSSVLLKLVGRS